MPGRRYALLIAFCLTLDLTNPFAGCAFNFNVEQSLEGLARQHERLLLTTPTQPASLPTVTSETASPMRVQAPGRRALPEWFAEARPAHAHASDPPSPTEDH